MDSSTDRSAQVAHVLHGVRPAEPGEDACYNCGVFICVICAIEGDLCRTCYLEEQENEAYYDQYDRDDPDDESPTYTRWDRVQDQWERGKQK